MLKVWNMVLVTLTFCLALFGTFLTRSGILSSVHAFGESTLGPYFLAFIACVLAGAIGLIVHRLPELRSQHSLESYLSREAVFLGNNLLLVGLAFAVFWGTVFPILSEAVRGERITVGEGYYDQVALPIGLALLVLTGVGPLVAWRKASPAQLRRRFLPPLAGAAAAAVLLALLTPAWERPAAGATFSACSFVLLCIGGEFWRGMRVRHALGGISWPGALGSIVARNRRRYGGYLVHVGIVVLFVGLAGSKAFATQGDITLQTGQRASVGGYEITMLGAERTPFDGHKMSVGAKLAVRRGGEPVATLFPHRNVYVLADGVQPSTEVAIHSDPERDVYVVLTGLVGGRASLSVFVNPLVMWLWIAGIIVACGALIAIWPLPRAVRRHAPVPERGGRRAEA